MNRRETPLERAHRLLAYSVGFLEALDHLDDEDDVRDHEELLEEISEFLEDDPAPVRPRLVMGCYPSGRLVDPFQITQDEIDVRDIAHHLALINRYNGGTRHPYSVAEHAVKVSYLAQVRADGITIADGPTVSAKWGLLHDATEAYLGDQHGALKKDPRNEWYVEEERLLGLKIAARFGLPLEMPKIVKKIDASICGSEMPLLCVAPSVRLDGTPHDPPIPGLVLGEWDWHEAETRFLARFVELWGSLS